MGMRLGENNDKISSLRAGGANCKHGSIPHNSGGKECGRDPGQ